MQVSEAADTCTKSPDDEKSTGEPSRPGAQARLWERECLGVWGSGWQEGQGPRLAQTQKLGRKGFGIFS